MGQLEALIWSVLFYAWCVSEILIAVLTRTKRGAGKREDRGTMLMLWLTIFSSMTACEWIRNVIAPSLPHSFRAIALMMLIVGLAVRWFAVFSLGKAFSANVAIRTSQRINQSGLYRLIRHPSYLGLILIFVAVGLHARNPLSLCFAVIPPTAMLLYRIHIEERALVAAFGSQYLDYMARTKRLLPYVY